MNQAEQINTAVMNNNGGSKLDLQGMVQDFLNHRDVLKRIKAIVGKTNRFNVNMDDLRQFKPELAKFVIKDPIQAIKMFQDQLNQTIKNLGKDQSSNPKAALLNRDNFPTKSSIYYINFEGNFGKNHITPRGLKADLVNQFIAVNGIVTRMSIVKPKIQTSVHYCEATKRGLIKQYNDQFNLTQLAEGEGSVTEQTNAFPTKDQDDNPLSAEYGYCVYKDSQIITIQEMPERAPTGQLPRSINVVLENDLVDKVKPGDRVQVTGVFRTVAPHSTQSSGVFRTFLVATGVTSLNAEKEKPNLTDTDIRNIKNIAKKENLFEILGHSIAPSIEGNLHVKKSLLLQLLGGAEKNLENGTHLRGDINIMMVGDPSTAKSQLLRHVMDIAPLAINTTGRGSSGVGLTAAVTIDKDTGERHLEAGAMVLADRGIVCIDEFDKMNDIDRVAIHEVMEQQTVTIAKAGIHVSLNARCSVIAAANPIYGEYARDQPVGRNIGLPDSLLSRFDLLFVMLDEKEEAHDRKIAARVINNHRYHQANQENPHFNYFNEDYVIEPEMKEDRKDNRLDSQFEKLNINFDNRNPTQLQIITREFLKKYLSYAKAQKHPELTDDAVTYATNLYSGLRHKALIYDQGLVAVPITVRTLETIIRLSTAHAKMRLSKKIEPIDVDVAGYLLNKTIFTGDSETGGKMKIGESDDDDDDDNEEVKVDRVDRKQNSRSRRTMDREMKSEDSPNKTVKREDKTPKKSLSKRTQPVKDDLDNRPSKKMKVDENHVVGQLFQSQGNISVPAGSQSNVKYETGTHYQKLVFAIINRYKDLRNSIHSKEVYSNYQLIRDNPNLQIDQNTKKSYFPQPMPEIKNWDHMKQILQDLESVGMVMVAEDGVVVLI